MICLLGLSDARVGIATIEADSIMDAAEKLQLISWTGESDLDEPLFIHKDDMTYKYLLLLELLDEPSEVERFQGAPRIHSWRELEMILSLEPTSQRLVAQAICLA